jgi:hypothetical protein
MTATEWLEVDGLKIHDLGELFKQHGQVVTVAHCSCLACVITGETVRRMNATKYEIGGNR